jgi:hypothetical protein
MSFYVVFIRCLLISPQYISRVIHHRGGPPDLASIDDPRNDLLREYSLHRIFGCGEVTFSMVITFVVTIQVFIAEL